MKPVSLQLTRTLNLAEFEPDQQVEEIVPVTADALGVRLNQAYLTATPIKNTFWSATWNLTGQELELWNEAHVGLYVVQDGTLERISPNMMRLQFGTDSLTCEFLHDKNVGQLLLVGQIEQLSANKFELLSSEYVHQLIIESPVDVSATCFASGKSIDLKSGVNLVKSYGRLSLEFYAGLDAPVQIVPVRVSDVVVYKNITQPAGRLVEVSESFTQKRGEATALVDKTSPSLNTLQFYEFDALCDQTKPQPSLTFSLPTPTDCLLVYRTLSDVLVKFQIKPSGSGIVPILSDQVVNLEG